MHVDVPLNKSNETKQNYIWMLGKLEKTIYVIVNIVFMKSKIQAFLLGKTFVINIIKCMNKGGNYVEKYFLFELNDIFFINLGTYWCTYIQSCL